ncbi:hypothetical protein IQ249_09525 [Lusitaniella coriacea LEGE 07157]|uniref:Uncharacterized protein n=1 Tax=Lusitaniella coriacea LEGE 07157 TaxID=945747 RepID=A0A8J7J242_9CYAN|nr:hypothetical protein [Lusitaniella coriacea]MBE9116134.1 hypothetical protein [Lusitaniella coriacea LEGE 07157]
MMTLIWKILPEMIGGFLAGVSLGLGEAELKLPAIAQNIGRGKGKLLCI